MNINKKLMILAKLCLFMFIFLLISACGQTEKYETIEDFYDMEGNYIQTEVIHSYGNKSKMLLTEDGNKLNVILQEPSTILITPEYTRFYELKNMTPEEKAQVKEHVLAFMEKLK